MSKQVMGQKFEGVLPFVESFGIRTVFPYVIHVGGLPEFNMLERLMTSLSYREVNLLYQKPCTPSCPGSFQGCNFPRIFFSLSLSMRMSSCWLTLANSSFTAFNHSVSFLCS